MPAPVVSIVKHDDTYLSLKKALELCDGLKDFKKGEKILIKPNMVSWDFDLPYPPYGVVTTSAVIFALVRLLHEAGYNNITVGEASLGVKGSAAGKIFKHLGYDKLQQKYGVKVIDFNEGKFEQLEVDGLKLSVARETLEADRIITVPVLKTHNQTKISLGIKNLKGCLDRKSKIRCHGKHEHLDHMFPRIAEKLPVSLNIIDGIYALAKGPGATGKAFRKDLLVASRDLLAADIVGAALLGYSFEEVEHLIFYAGRNRPDLDLTGIVVKGEPVEKHTVLLEHDWEWTEDNVGPLGFKKRGIRGLAVRKYDDSLCTACSKLYNPLLILLMSAFKGEPFPGVEVLTGKRQQAAPGFSKTILFGKCAYMENKDNPNINKAIAVKGCPPDLDMFQEKLKSEGIDCDYSQYIKYRHYLFNRYKKEDGFDMNLFLF